MNPADDLSRLAADLGRVGATVQRGVRAVVERGALNVKRGMAEDFSGIKHAPHFPRSIDYTMTGVGAALGGVVGADIGPNKDKTQGALGNILAFGTSKNAPVADIGASLAREAPAFMRALGDLGESALGG